MCPPILHNLGPYKFEYLILHKLDSMSSLKHQRFGNPTAPQAQSPKSLPSDKFHSGSKGSSTPNISSPELSPRLKNIPVKPGKTGTGLRRRPLPPSKSCLSALELQAFLRVFFEQILHTFEMVCHNHLKQP